MKVAPINHDETDATFIMPILILPLDLTTAIRNMHSFYKKYIPILGVIQMTSMPTLTHFLKVDSAHEKHIQLTSSVLYVCQM